MRLEASLQARQEMRLKLAPQIIQSIEILQLPLLDLRERIEEELLENPLLEVTPASEENTAEESTEESETASNGEEPDVVEVLSEEPEGEHENDPMESEDYEALDDLFQPTDYESFNGEYRARPTPAASGTPSWPPSRTRPRRTSPWRSTCASSSPTTSWTPSSAPSASN